MAISAPAAPGFPEAAQPAGTAASPPTPTVPIRVFDVQALPLVDTAVLEVLEEQLGRSDLARNFAQDYTTLWGQRERRLVTSLESEDRAAAIDAVISLKVSSAMVGGLRLARLAEALESAVREGDLRYGATVLAMISVQGRATVNELQHVYLP